MNSKKEKILFIVLPFAVLIIAVAAVFFAVGKPHGVNRYSRAIKGYAQKYGVEPELIAAVVRAESSFNPNALSEKGAEGLMQIMPETAEFIAQTIFYEKDVDLFDWECNLELGTAYLAYLFEKFDGEYEVLCAYNAGEGRVVAWLNDSAYSSDGKTLDIVPFKETRVYAQKVTDYKKRYARYFA